MDDKYILDNLNKILESLDVQDDFNSIRRIYNISKRSLAVMESNSALNKINNLNNKVKFQNLQNIMSETSGDTKTALLYLLFESLTEIPRNTQAYNLGIINDACKILKKQLSSDDISIMNEFRNKTKKLKSLKNEFNVLAEKLDDNEVVVNYMLENLLEKVHKLNSNKV